MPKKPSERWRLSFPSMKLVNRNVRPRNHLKTLLRLICSTTENGIIHEGGSNMIDDSVKIGSNVKIGEHVIIGENVEIGNNVVIGHHVVINRDTCIGDQVVINELTYLGRVPAANKSMAHHLAKELDRKSVV